MKTLGSKNSLVLSQSTNRKLSVCVLYSMIVLGGRFSTRFNVSRMRDVVVWSSAVRFHRDRMSSCINSTYMSDETCGEGGILNWQRSMYTSQQHWDNNTTAPGCGQIWQLHRSLHQPWTVHQASLESSFPSSETPDLSSAELSTCHQTDLHHPTSHTHSYT